MKSLKDISLPITEEEYRNDGCMHYSTIASFDRGGFSSLPTLFDKKESPSLLLGSIVDCLITGTPEEFESQYLVADYPECSDTIINIVKGLFSTYNETYKSITDIPNSVIIDITEQLKYQLNWKPDTRAKVIKEKGAEYYRLMFLSLNKTIVSSSMYNEALACVRALHTSPATKYLFAADNPFEPEIERLYQLKFKETFDGITYSIMIDETYVDHKKKIILPIDLKTSFKHEYDFFKSFIEWSYSHQARNYYRVLKANIDKDDYFKDFTLLNWHFVVVNKESLNPLVWEYKDTKKEGTLYYGKNNQIVIRDPFEIAKELKYYLDSNPSVPIGVSIDKPNDLIQFLNTL